MNLCCRNRYLTNSLKRFTTEILQLSIWMWWNQNTIHILCLRALRNCLYMTKTWLMTANRLPRFKPSVRSVYNLTTRHRQAFTFILIGLSCLPIICTCGIGQRHVQTANGKHVCRSNSLGVVWRASSHLIHSGRHQWEDDAVEGNPQSLKESTAFCSW